MKIIKGVSIFTTVINIIMTIASVLMTILCYLFLGVIEQYAGDTFGSLMNTDGSSAVIGSEVFARFGSGIMEIAGNLILVVATLFFIVLTVCFLIPSVFGIVTNAKAKKTVGDLLAYVKAYKNDAIIKIVLNGLPIGAITWASIASVEDIVNYFGWFLFWIILTGLSVFQYVEAKRILAHDIKQNEN